MKTFALRRDISASDQRFPCSAITDDECCKFRSQFQITHRCSCDLPVVMSCTYHLAKVIRKASKLCRHHGTVPSVIVWPLGGSW